MTHRPPLGQHFLRDPNVIKTILAAAELTPNTTALEIGPGKGILTEALVPRVGTLVVVELDKTLARDLQHRFQDNVHVTIIPGDFLRVDLSSLFPRDDARQPMKILGNLPYSITSPIFEKILTWPAWDTGVFLIQREVADRMRSGPGSRSFGILSLAVQLFAKVELILNVKPGAFRPPPKVQSAVIRLRRKVRPDVPPETIPSFFDLAHGAFAHRRKTLGNSLSYHSGLAKKAVENWLKQQSVDPGKRAETLELEDYVRLSEKWAIFRRENGFDIAPDNVYNTERFSD
ncbi:MAG: 16S rRNA (adenine(1518)-N(6)/adenine(1519)-N(6))-dimethyltransferase RsmA [Elusimicrobiota bacterium]|jgi:16S rRNA (adenine1518-N6/adenine1519-N6)-dimethyltransferase